MVPLHHFDAINAEQPANAKRQFGNGTNFAAYAATVGAATTDFVEIHAAN